MLLNKIVDFISKENPDILALQEVYDGKDVNLAKNYRSLDVLKNELEYDHIAFSPAFTDNRDEGKIIQGNAVFSKCPIKEKKTSFYDIPYQDNYVEDPINFPYIPRNLQYVLIQLNGGVINMFNTHGIWGEDGEDSKRRIKMSETIASEINKIKNSSPIILSGDLNVKEGTKTIRNIENHLTNVFKGELNTTFNLRRKNDPGFATAIVDMVFVGGNIKVIEHYCPNVDVSDHLPLVCIFKI